MEGAVGWGLLLYNRLMGRLFAFKWSDTKEARRLSVDAGLVGNTVERAPVSGRGLARLSYVDRLGLLCYIACRGIMSASSRFLAN